MILVTDGILGGPSGPFFIETMAEPKTPRQELLEAIETYAASKAQEDKLLQRLAMVHLATVLKKVDIIAPIPAPQAEAIKAQLPAVPPAKKPAAKKPAARKPRATKKVGQ